MSHLLVAAHWRPWKDGLSRSELAGWPMFGRRSMYAPILFQRPTRLADGLGLKETAPAACRDLHPYMWFPRSLSVKGLDL